MCTFWLIFCTCVHTHTIIHALQGFSMMFPHFSIYPCVRGLSFLYLLLNNNKCSPSLYLPPLWVSTGCAAAQMILRLSCQLLLRFAYTLFSKATRKPPASNSGRPCKVKAKKTWLLLTALSPSCMGCSTYWRHTVTRFVHPKHPPARHVQLAAVRVRLLHGVRTSFQHLYIAFPHCALSPHHALF